MQKNAEHLNKQSSNFLKFLFHRETILFLLLFGTVFFLYKKAIHVPFILDDFFFLNLGHAQNISEFVQFFSPFKGFFYRPLTTESFYFLVNAFQQNLVIAHTISFLFFFTGLYFLYKILYFLTKNTLFSFRSLPTSWLSKSLLSAPADLRAAFAAADQHLDREVIRAFLNAQASAAARRYRQTQITKKVHR
jgi:hypothetical protein